MFSSARIFIVSILLTAFGITPLYSSSLNNQDRKAAPLEIINITPSGEDVSPGRQIVFQFNRAVVPVGKMDRDEAEIPIEITPEIEGQWRWLDTDRLALIMDKTNKMHQATRYNITVRPGIMSEDGATLTKTVTHSFITERPKIVRANFKVWESPGMPFIRVNLNQTVSRDSVKKHLFFKMPDKRRVSINLKPDTEPQYMFGYRGEQSENTDSGGDLKKDKALSGQRWVVYPDKELPLDTKVELVVEPGIESVNGPEQSVENRTVTTIDTIPDFTFTGARCNVSGRRVLIRSGSDQAECSPGSLYLEFSSPVFRKDITENIEISPALSGEEQKTIDNDIYEIDSIYRRPHRSGRNYSIAITKPLGADTVYTLKSEPGGIRDAFGRTLKNPIDFSISTTHYNPQLYISSAVEVLDKNNSTDIQAEVMNLKTLTFQYSRMTTEGVEAHLSTKIPAPEIKDELIPVYPDVRKMLKGRSGALKGTVISTPDIYRYNPLEFKAQVTPFHVHTKLSHFSTLVWVTDIETGEPVPGAVVKIYKNKIREFINTSKNPEIITKGVTDREGAVLLAGTEKIDSGIDFPYRYRQHSNIMVQVEKGEDIALMPLTYDFRVPSPFESRQNCFIKAWGTTSQGVYKPGEKIKYKIYVRDQDRHSFIKAPVKGYNLSVTDPMNKTVFELNDLTLSDFGALEGEFEVPESGASGWYRFKLTGSFLKQNYFPMKVLVSDFTPAPFNVTSNIDKKIYKPGDVLNVTTSARLHNGGAYGDTGGRVSASMSYTHEDWFFQTDAAKGFMFNTYEGVNQALYEEEGKLDKNGDMISKIKLPESNILFGQIYIESAVRDERGKYTAEKNSAKYAARDRFVGLKPDDTPLAKDELSTIQIIVVDEEGNPAAGVPVNIVHEKEDVAITRVENEWGALKKKYTREWKLVEQKTVTSTDEPLKYSYTYDRTFRGRISAAIKDTKERKHRTEIMLYPYGHAAGSGQESVIDSLEIVPDKEIYKVGDTARYEIKNPVPDARVLVSVERNGVIKHWVHKLDKNNPFIDVKIEADYIPAIYLSAVMVSSGDDSVNENDQGKKNLPIVKTGYIHTFVDDVDKKLSVNIKPEKKVYKPGDHVKINLKAVPERGSNNEPVELAVTVLNEEVLALISAGGLQSPQLERLLDNLYGDDQEFIVDGLSYFDLYKGFYQPGRLDAANYNLLKQLVIYKQKMNERLNGPRGTLYARGSVSGVYDDDDSFTLEEITVSAEKREAELQKVPMDIHKVSFDGSSLKGKDGVLRSDLKFISYWNPSIKTDKDGNAAIEFDAPDNLTGWRVIVMAVTLTDKMGMGSSKFSVNKDTEIRPVMPNQVTEGDSFKAGFSIMNRIEKTRELTLTITAEGAVETDGQKLKQVTKSVTAESYKRIPIFIEIKAKGSGTVRFTAEGGDAEDMDGLVHEFEVRKMASLETAAVYGTTVENKVTESIKFPEAIRTDVGTVNVNLSPTVIGQVEGAFKYLRDYPYICWEQNLTKGVMAAHYLNLKQYMPDEFTWDGAEQLPRAMLEKASGFQAPNGGMTYYIAEDRYVSPYLSAYTALAFTWLKERGYEIPEDVQEKLNEYLLDFILKKEQPSFYSSGMASTVRAVALAALAKQGEVNRGHLIIYHPYLKEMDLFGKAHFLMAAVEIENTEEMQKEVFKMILSHADQTSGKYVFNEAFDDGYSRILTSSLRSNAAVLSSLITYGKTEEGKKLVGDIPFKLVRYITQTRKQSGRWENTQENIFCMNALVEYSKAYESEKPDMKITAMLGKDIMGKAKFKDVRDDPVEIKRAIKKDDPGRKTNITIERKGEGRLYYSAGLTYAPLKLKTEPINAGIDIKREYSVERDGEWVLLKSPMKIKRGELVRVDLFVSLPAARNFVVVDDPVPGGIEPVNSDLATASQVDADKGKFKPAGGSWWFHYGDWSYYGMNRWSFYHRELRHHAARFYSEYLPAGNYHLSYTAQAIAPGEFTVMPSHAEEMYDPDVFGKSGAGVLNVFVED